MGLIDDKTSGNLNLLKQTIKEWVNADQLRLWILVVPGFFFGLKAISVSTQKVSTMKVDVTPLKTLAAV